MSKKDSLLKFVNDGNFSNEDIEIYITNHCLNKKTFLYNVMNLLYDKVSSSMSTKNDYRLNTINRTSDLLYILCRNIELNKEDVEVCNKQICEIVQILKPYLKKSRNKSLSYTIELLESIKLDNEIDIKKLNSLIIKLIDNKENLDIIKKFICCNKNTIVENDTTLFDYVFSKTIDSLKNNNEDIYYYISLLSLFYSSNIKKDKCISELDQNSNIDNPFSKEIYQIIHGCKSYNSCEEILEKYKINANIPNCPITIKKTAINNDRIITIDSTKTILKDDGLSIKKDGNKYIVGIHITDAGKCIDIGSDIDLIARNNFKCLYMENSTRTNMLPSNVENKLSFKKGVRRPSLVINVVLNDSGDILDYYITQNDIKITDSLTYIQSEQILDHVSISDLDKSLSELFMLASILEEKSNIRSKYWDKKQANRTTEKSRNTKSDIIVRQFMVMYNILIAKIAKEENIPFIYRTQSEEYITQAVKDLNFSKNDQLNKILEGIYLSGEYSTLCAPHFGLGEEAYSHSSNPLRRYTDLYNQYLIHMFILKDKKISFNYEEFLSLIEYSNQRSKELSLLNSEFNKEAKLIRKKNT